jgi:hypothetical protein
VSLQRGIKRLGAALKPFANPIHEEADTCWIFGAGRSGSTWLIDLLSHLGGTCTWHEPYFGMLFLYPFREPGVLQRDEAFFADSQRAVWCGSLRSAFFDSARARYGHLPPGTKLIVKDVNAPALCPFFADVFPNSRYLLLLRDPFDTLDSHIDMQRPGSWNAAFGSQGWRGEPDMAQLKRTAEHIRSSMDASVTGYERVTPSLRLELRYEEMTADPIGSLAKCVTFLGMSAEQAAIERAVEECRFDKIPETGKTKFRRFGKAGIWQTSGNFTPEVTAIAQETLGDLRARLRYGETK